MAGTLPFFLEFFSTSRVSCLFLCRPVTNTLLQKQHRRNVFTEGKWGEYGSKWQGFVGMELVRKYTKKNRTKRKQWRVAKRLTGRFKFRQERKQSTPEWYISTNLVSTDTGTRSFDARNFQRGVGRFKLRQEDGHKRKKKEVGRNKWSNTAHLI